MLSLRLENSLDAIDLNEQATTGYGVQALAGLNGLGLPAVSQQWIEGAGDGATYRGSRVLSRDIDIVLDVRARDREGLLQYVSRLSKMLSGEFTLVVLDGPVRWTSKAVRVGGGDYTYGVDTTGERDWQTVVTVRCGDPYFTSSETSLKTITSGGTGTSFLSNLVGMPVSSSQAIGEITLENTGDARAYPTWRVYGPGHDFKAISPTGETLWWQGTLLAGESLIVDTLKGTVVDQAGVNRYDGLAAAPRFWSVPPGTTTVTAELLGVTTESRIECSWRPRRWMVM
jgi:Phage tail protein